MEKVIRAAVVGGLLALLLVSAVDAAPPRPNLVYVMADDLGIGDVQCYGGQRCRIDTPNMDRLAAEGIRFTDAHAPASHCIPVRVAVMTGRYAWRFGAPRPSGPWGYLNPRIPRDELTLGKMLRGAGYRTGYVGKWHLGTLMVTTNGENQGPNNVDYTKPLKIGPPQHGFDESFILPGSLDMFPYAFVRDGRFVGEVTARKGWSAFNRIGPAEKDFEDYKVLDALSTEAEAFVARNAKAARDDGKPFFLYFALTAPHTPTSPGPAFQGKSKLGLYGDFVTETDHCLGRVMRALEKHGLERNTLVVMTSDHGAAAYAGNVRKATIGNMRALEKLGHWANGIYRGYKFSIHEGGLRVPFIARWPARIEAGATCAAQVALVDIARTFAELAGAKLEEPQAPDSISFVPLLDDPKASPPRTSTIMRSTSHFAIRDNKWKLALCPGSGTRARWESNLPSTEIAWRNAVEAFGRSPTRADFLKPPFVQLYDMSNDPVEAVNLASKHPEVVARLVKLLRAQIKAGRTTPGEARANDVDEIDPIGRVPGFVLRR